MTNPPKKSWQGSEPPPPLPGNARIFTASVTATPPLDSVIGFVFVMIFGLPLSLQFHPSWFVHIWPVKSMIISHNLYEAPLCWNHRRHWGMSTQTPKKEKNHVPLSRRLPQMSVDGPTLWKEDRFINLSQKGRMTSIIDPELTLTPATFSEGWWLLSPWSSARLRSFKGLWKITLKTQKIPWPGRQPSHHGPAWLWWVRRGETRGRHRAARLETAATFVFQINFLVQT